MNLTSLGVGSGLDLESIVTAFIDAEAVPQEIRLQNKEEKLTTELSGVGSFKSALSSFDSILKKLASEDAFNKQNQEIQNIEYDSYHIHIQNFSSYYITVVISGTYNVIFKGLLEDKLLDFAQNIINKEDIKNEESLTKKLIEHFKDEDF